MAMLPPFAVLLLAALASQLPPSTRFLVLTLMLGAVMLPVCTSTWLASMLTLPAEPAVPLAVRLPVLLTRVPLALMALASIRPPLLMALLARSPAALALR